MSREKLPISQKAREAASALSRELVPNGIWREIANGNRDENRLVQAFAAFEQEAVDLELDRILAWFERNKIVNSGAAFFDEAFGPLFSDDGEREIDGRDIGLEAARAIRTRAWRARAFLTGEKA